MFNNLRRNGFKVVAINDKFPEKCAQYADVEVKDTPRELAEAVDVIISGSCNPKCITYVRGSRRMSHKVYQSHQT